MNNFKDPRYNFMIQDSTIYNRHIVPTIDNDDNKAYTQNIENYIIKNKLASIDYYSLILLLIVYIIHVLFVVIL